jgi:hypothetical protein
MNYKTPGVYVEEITKLPPSIAGVETAIPAFIGYTEKARQREDDDLLMTPKRVTSLLEYETYFGAAQNEISLTVDIKTTANPVEIIAKNNDPSKYLMYYSMQAFFANGGGPCYIVSVGGYASPSFIDLGALQDGLAKVGEVDEATLLVIPGAQGLGSAADYYALQRESINQCVELQDRFAVMEVWTSPDPTVNNIDLLRNTLAGTKDELKYAAVYYPNLEFIFDYSYNATEVVVTVDGTPTDLATLESANNAQYNQARAALNNVPVVLPPASAVVGVYARVDNSRGVWKAPANENIDGAIRPVLKITDQSQRDLNVDSTAGKSINAIRSFTGRGPAYIWGARTLAGNDNEWRYVPVRRFFNFVEESTKKATVQFVFEPNDANTWTRVRSMIENFLQQQWKAGALQGAVPAHAFYVRIGLGETMTPVDILAGRMNVEIGMAVVRPAEFIILKFSHKLAES